MERSHNYYYLLGYLAALLLAMIIDFMALQTRYNLPNVPLVGILSLQCLTIAYSLYISRKHAIISTRHYALLLIASSMILSAFIYFSGGHTNPLLSLLLIPLALSASQLTVKATATIALITLIAYSILTQYYVPLTEGLAGSEMLHDAGSHGSHISHAVHSAMSTSTHFMDLHFVGMWLTFILSVLLILALVLPLTLETRTQQKKLSQQAERIAHAEKLIAMATFSASSAHALGTPLSTLAIITDDLKEQYTDDAQTSQDLTIMQQQIKLCKSTLQDMMQQADDLKNNKLKTVRVQDLLNETRQQFNLLHPHHELPLQVDNVTDKDAILCDTTLVQALVNLLDNAVQHAKVTPTLHAQCHDGQLILNIDDTGPGIPPQVRDQLGQPFISTKDDGVGIGLFLSHHTINRLGGTLTIDNTANSQLTIVLPLQNATPAPAREAQ